MKNQSARFNTGHFFHITLLLLFIGMSISCSDVSPLVDHSRELPETGEIVVLIRFTGQNRADNMPEAISNLSATATGRFYTSDSESSDPFHRIAEEADSAGKLILLVLPEGEEFEGSREHLIIWIDSLGVPVREQPELDSYLLSDSLWENPVVRQETILQLVQFFKPDIILETVPERESSASLAEYWSENGIRNNITIAMYSLPDRETSYRGWGAFTGKGIQMTLIEGMDVQGFAATVRLVAGIKWNSPGGGYPAMQAFFTTETE